MAPTWFQPIRMLNVLIPLGGLALIYHLRKKLEYYNPPEEIPRPEEDHPRQGDVNVVPKEDGKGWVIVSEEPNKSISLPEEVQSPKMLSTWFSRWFLTKKTLYVLVALGSLIYMIYKMRRVIYNQEEEIRRLKDDLQSQGHDNLALKEGGKGCRKDLEEANKSIKETKNELEKREATISEVGREMLAELSKDETSVLKERYSLLSFQTASNLKKAFIKPPDIPEEFWHIFVSELFFSIFQTACDEMSCVHTETLQKLDGWLRQPMLQKWQRDSAESTDSSDLPENIKQVAVQFAKEHAGEVIVDTASKVVIEKSFCRMKEELEKKGQVQRDDPRLDEALKDIMGQVNSNEICQLDSFVKSVCRLSWEMAMQQPPMLFQSKGVDEACNEDLQKVLPSAKINFSRLEYMLVDYYLEPYLTHGGVVLERGRVVLYDPEQPRISMIPAIDEVEQKTDVQITDEESAAVANNDAQSKFMDPERKPSDVSCMSMQNSGEKQEEEQQTYENDDLSPNEMEGLDGARDTVKDKALETESTCNQVEKAEYTDTSVNGNVHSSSSNEGDSSETMSFEWISGSQCANGQEEQVNQDKVSDSESSGEEGLDVPEEYVNRLGAPINAPHPVQTSACSPEVSSESQHSERSSDDDFQDCAEPDDEHKK